MRKCGECGYDLRGLDRPRCPECGTPFQAGHAPKPASIHWLSFAAATFFANVTVISLVFCILKSFGHIQDDLLLQPLEQLILTLVLFSVILFPSWMVIILAPRVYRLLPASALLILCLYELLLGLLYTISILYTAGLSVLFLGNIPLCTLPLMVGVLWDVRTKDRTE